MSDTTRYIGLKIISNLNNTILVRKFKRTNTWTIPHTIVPEKANIFSYINKVLAGVSVNKEFKIISAISIFEHDIVDELWNPMKQDYTPHTYKITIYELKYSGAMFVTPATNMLDIYSEGRWIPLSCLKTLRPVNRVTDTFCLMLENKTCEA